MVIYTAKLTKTKLLALALGLLALLAILIVAISGCSQDDSVRLKDNAARVAYLQSLGWEVSAEPAQTQQVRIPEQMDEVLERYNELQLAQGLDLSGHLGKHAMRYVYTVANYPDAEGEVYATLLVRSGKLIAADLSGTAGGGFLRALTGEQPQAALSIIA